MMYITSKEELAENLKGIREDRDLKHYDVAKALHISRSAYTYYETAKNPPFHFNSH